MEFVKKFLATLRLVRFEHALMFGLSVLIAELIATNGIIIFSQTIFFSFFVPILSEMGAFALNDLMDVESDRINKKMDRPLVSGELSKNFAMQISVASFMLALVLAYLINPFIFINSLAIFYNILLKDLPLIGNIYVALTMGIPFIFGNYVVSDVLNPANVLLAILGFIVGLGREITKTVEDMRGDKTARKSKTLPMFIGSEKSLTIAGILYALFAVISVVPYYLYLNVGPALFLVMVADGIFLYFSIILIFSKRKNQFLPLARKLSLLALLLGLFGILGSVLGY
ncbi:MAG: UbiA family prenyltransferase [Candidatus Paceibacteria bacterium]